jgi:hypothetical protein
MVGERGFEPPTPSAPKRAQINVPNQREGTGKFGVKRKLLKGINGRGERI